EIADCEISQQSCKQNRRRKANQAHLEDPGCEDENLERRRWRQQRGNQHSTKSVSHHPLPNRLSPFPCTLMEKCLSALLGNEEKQHTAQQRTNRGRQRVKGHSRRVLNRKLDQQQIVDDRKR